MVAKAQTEVAQKEETMLEKLKLVGIEISKPDIDLVGGNVTASTAVSHRGKIGGFKITFDGDISFLPLVNSAVDWVEKKIPGDQTGIASVIKTALANIKL